MLQGALVNLVALEEEQLELLRKWRTSPEVYDYLFDFRFISKAQQKIWYQNTLNDTSRKLMMIENKQSEPLGFVQLGQIDYINRSAEWGFFIGDPQDRYCGYTAEAEFLLLKYAFDFLNFNKLYCFTFAFNKKVLSMHAKFGFKEEGVLKEHIFHHGRYEDVVMMSIFKNDYEKSKDDLASLFSRFAKEHKDMEGLSYER